MRLCVRRSCASTWQVSNGLVIETFFDAVSIPDTGSAVANEFEIFGRDDVALTNDKCTRDRLDLNGAWYELPDPNDYGEVTVAGKLCEGK